MKRKSYKILVTVYEDELAECPESESLSNRVRLKANWKPLSRGGTQWEGFEAGNVKNPAKSRGKKKGA